MPTVYTMEGARGRNRRRSGGGSAQRSKFKAAAKHCKGKSLRDFRACMRKELRR